MGDRWTSYINTEERGLVATKDDWKAHAGDLEDEILRLTAELDYWRTVARDLARSGRCQASEECDEEPALRDSCLWWESYAKATGR